VTSPDDASRPAGRGAQRATVAAEARALAHAFVAHDPDGETLEDITATLAGLRARVAACPARDRRLSGAEQLFAGWSAVERHPFGDVEGPLADRPILGATNPFAVEGSSRIEGQEAVTDVVLGPGFQGAPDRAHGGIVAAIFDDVTGHALRFAEVPAFTGTLTIRYHRPTPLGAQLQFRARLDGRDGRRLFISADCHSGGEVIATCEAVYVVVDLSRFAERRNDDA
jgi:acyl-coenzyme A thioesterase PaaI-like protein